jgi:hypothetical protein
LFEIGGETGKRYLQFVLQAVRESLYHIKGKGAIDPIFSGCLSLRPEVCYGEEIDRKLLRGLTNQRKSGKSFTVRFWQSEKGLSGLNKRTKQVSIKVHDSPLVHVEG